MRYIKVAIGVLVALSASRFIPHPPNFTSLIALSFYIPAVFGIRYIPAVILALLFTDFIIGFHSTMLFTSGSIVLIGLISEYFNKSILFRIFGALIGAIIFFLISNFGVWLGGSYGYNFNGFISCYILALPFFGYTLISTFVFSVIIETAYKLFQKNIVNIYK
tara:strand:+ start:150 stop:638 length:489 start_codon:yes stop_codon:yes gene_type:complete